MVEHGLQRTAAIPIYVMSPDNQTGTRRARGEPGRAGTGKGDQMTATTYETMLNYWKTTGKWPPRPTKAELEKNSALLWHWMELTGDISTIEALQELREERQTGREKIVGLVKDRAWDLACHRMAPGNA